LVFDDYERLLEFGCFIPNKDCSPIGITARSTIVQPL